ncbi:hypothetical protein [Metasolibacillus sp.]|nr:hypothetical protein [Metasolibacillus sp.]
MIQLVNQSAEDRYALFQYTANELKMSEAIVEKDLIWSLSQGQM